MRKYFVIKSLSEKKWLYVMPTADSLLRLNEDVRWAGFYHSISKAEEIIKSLPNDKDSYYTIEEIYHKF